MNLKKFALPIVLAITLSACSDSDSSSSAPLDDIVDTAIAAGTFDTLVTAVQEAGLEETLRGAGPFTVFAPTDEAFAALPEGTLETLLADPDALADILLYHVIADELLAADVLELATIETVQGQSITVSIVGEDAFVDDAQITTTDIVTSNGIIHVIDSVLLPD